MDEDDNYNLSIKISMDDYYYKYQKYRNRYLMLEGHVGSGGRKVRVGEKNEAGKTPGIYTLG